MPVPLSTFFSSTLKSRPPQPHTFSQPIRVRHNPPTAPPPPPPPPTTSIPTRLSWPAHFRYSTPSSHLCCCVRPPRWWWPCPHRLRRPPLWLRVWSKFLGGKYYKKKEEDEEGKRKLDAHCSPVLLWTWILLRSTCNQTHSNFEVRSWSSMIALPVRYLCVWRSIDREQWVHTGWQTWPQQPLRRWERGQFSAVPPRRPWSLKTKKNVGWAELWYWDLSFNFHRFIWANSWVEVSVGKCVTFCQPFANNSTLYPEKILYPTEGFNLFSCFFKSSVSVCILHIKMTQLWISSTQFLTAIL